MTIAELKESEEIKDHKYKKGMLGQYNAQFNQIQKWKKQRAKYLKDINALSQLFFYRYEPYLKEGTWTDSNYITDNAYYHDALTVAAEGAIPKVTYSIKVTPLGILDEDYEIGVADTSYIEDEGMFGINQKTGLPNRLKVIISELNESLDKPTDDSITVQNFTTQFEDLFQQVTASVQSLTFNENIYKRSSNFTPSQVIEQASIQGALDTNQLTYLNTSEGNIKLDQTGQSGSDINNHNNKYKLNGQGLYFSNNGGVTWSVGVGPSGINADYINTGTLDAGNIRIVDGSYLYFLWDKGGITAYRDAQNLGANPSGTDFARFNKYGLSLAENNRIRLRAGYRFNGENGNITSETGQGEDIGFYLYDMRGNTIFSTEASDSNSARLNLAGEMLATAKIESTTGVGVYIYNQAKNYGSTPPSEYQQRLFSIANVKSNEIQNLLTVLKDGSLHMGGTLEPYHSDRNTIDSLDDYVKVNGAKGTITMKNGELLLDGTNLKTYVDEVKGIANDAKDIASAATSAANSAKEAAININNTLPGMQNQIEQLLEDVAEQGIVNHRHTIVTPPQGSSNTPKEVSMKYYGTQSTISGIGSQTNGGTLTWRGGIGPEESVQAMQVGLRLICYYNGSYYTIPLGQIVNGLQAKDITIIE